MRFQFSAHYVNGYLEWYLVVSSTILHIEHGDDVGPFDGERPFDNVPQPLTPSHSVEDQQHL